MDITLGEAAPESGLKGLSVQIAADKNNLALPLLPVLPSPIRFTFEQHVGLLGK